MPRLASPLVLVLPLAVACAADAPPPPASANAAPSADPPPTGAANPILEEHNRLRALHCAPPLAWSPALEKSAQAWADHLASAGCELEHSSGPHGENLAAGSIGAMDGPGVVRYWYDENAQYTFGRGGFSSGTGHFTQVVWSGTREVGCGRTQCQGMDVWVCQYDPPGNMQGAFAENVKPKTCGP